MLADGFGLLIVDDADEKGLLIFLVLSRVTILLIGCDLPLNVFETECKFLVCLKCLDFILSYLILTTTTGVVATS